MVIHTVTSTNLHLYARQIDEMFRMRHEFYVRQRGWTNLTSSNGRETDEFDDLNAVYLMNLDQFGNILSTFRLNPTTGPYLVADKLPHYLSEPAPRQEDIWDLGRWMVAPHARRKQAGQIADVQKPLIVGLMEFAVSRGITGFTALTDTAFVSRISDVWPTRPMGEPHGFDDADGEAQLIMIEAGPHILAETRNKTGIYNPILFEIEPDIPASKEEQTQREETMLSTSPLTRNHVDQLNTAADHMLREIKESDDVENSIQAIEEFTQFIRGFRERTLENA